MASLPEFANKKGLTPEQIREIVEFLGQDFSKDFLDQPFQDKSTLFRTPFNPGRFSDGSWPVFYAASDRSTAQQEILHHFGRIAVGANAQRDAFYSMVICDFAGITMDLTQRLEDWPDLCAEDYGFCQRLGKEAVERLLDAFRAPSARKIDGITVPVFQRDALSNPKIEGVTRFSRASELDPITVAVVEN